MGVWKSDPILPDPHTPIPVVRIILHVDLDAFYASVEQRDRPELRGQPVAVAGNSRRAVVTAASYEARPFGVRSAMPLYRARELCPRLLTVPPNFEKYRYESRFIMSVFRRYTPLVEPLSLDEAFLDVSDAAGGITPGEALAREIRAAIRAERDLAASIGVATNKMVAKIASDLSKPDGLLSVPAGAEREFLAPLPAARLWGIGPRSQERLRQIGVSTIGDLVALDDEELWRLFGKNGPWFKRLGLGQDDRPVEPSRPTQSISSETTFEYDLTDEASVARVLDQLAAEVAGHARAQGLAGRTVGVKIRLADFSIRSRQQSLPSPIDDAATLASAALACFRRAGVEGRPVRLLGVRLAGFEHRKGGEAPRQLELWEG